MIDMIVKETLLKITDDLEYWANQPTGEFESGVVAGLVRAQSALIEVVESYKNLQSIEILEEHNVEGR